MLKEETTKKIVKGNTTEGILSSLEDELIKKKTVWRLQSWLSG